MLAFTKYSRHLIATTGVNFAIGGVTKQCDALLILPAARGVVITMALLGTALPTFDNGDKPVILPLIAKSCAFTDANTVIALWE